MKWFYRQQGKKSKLSKKEWIVSDYVTYLWRKFGVFHADYLTSVGQKASD